MPNTRNPNDQDSSHQQRGGSHEQHVKAGQQSHGGSSPQKSASGGSERGGGHEQHGKSGDQSHKNG
jgi:hypothetical protein